MQELGSPRMKEAVRVVKAINGCWNKEQVRTARKLVENFIRLYDDTLPLSRWLLQKEFEIYHGH